MNKSKQTTQTRNIQQVVRDVARSEIDASVRMAIQSLQSQLNNLYSMISQMNLLGEQNIYTEQNELHKSFSELSNLFNRSGVGRNHGDVVVIDKNNNNAFTTTNVANWEECIGVVAADSPNGTSAAIQPLSAGLVCTGGPADVKIYAGGIPVEPGSPIRAHSISGIGIPAAHAGEVGIFAIALEGLSTGTGLVKCFVQPRARYENYDVGQETTTKIHYNLSGDITSATTFRESTMSIIIAHDVFCFSADGSLLSTWTSAMNVPGTARVATIKNTVNYLGARLDKIIKDISS